MAKRGKSMAIGEIRSTHPGFESDDPILARIYELPSSCRTLDRALPEALRLACSLPDWSLGRYRSLTDGLDGRAWTWHRAADPGTDTTPGGLVGLERGGGDHASPAELPPVAVELLRPEASRLHAVLYAAGLRTIGRLVVRAEDRPTALVELFGWPRVDGRSLRLVLARLEHVAARDRSREAVRRAAAFVRAHTSGRVDGRDRLPAAEPVAEPAAAAPPAVRPVPGLPDRDMLTDRLAMAIKRRRRDARGLLAVYHVDPGLGPGLSDIGPAAIVRRLTTIVRDTDTVAHGDRPDEFVVVAEELADVEAARDLGRRIVAACRKPVTYGPEARPLAARVGFLVAGPAHDDVDGILRDVALARDRVPAEGGLEMFDANVRIEDDNRQLIEAELRRAIGSRELFLEYQPIVSLADGRIAGLEAFIRWQHPTVGRIPPTEFIGVAEVSPLIHDLGDWVADQVCQQVRRWATHVPPSRIPPVDINYSQTQLLHASFVQRLVAILRRNELPGEAIRIDVNESDLMEAAATVLGLLERLQHHGVQAVIDDFGTGFSSLQMLHALPVGALKIDGAFLPGEASGVESWVIARSIVELGRVLGLDVIAEGVETGEQIRTLRQIGCRLGQGFAFSGPVGAGRALELIRDGYPLDVGSTAG